MVDNASILCDLRITQPIYVVFMRLKEWLEETNIKPAEFSRRTGIKKNTLHNYLYGRRIPTIKFLPIIVKETKNDVGYKDFAAHKRETKKMEEENNE